MDFRNFLSSKSEKISFFEQFLVIFLMKKASNQKMVLEKIVQNLMRAKILKKTGGGILYPPRYLTFLKKPGNKGVNRQKSHF